MDAVKFIKERQRFCKQVYCVNCVLKRDGIECGTFNLINEPENLSVLLNSGRRKIRL